MRSVIRTGLLSLAATLSISAPLFAQSDLDQRINKEAGSLLATYKHLHENPELSTQEKETSALSRRGPQKIRLRSHRSLRPIC